MKFSMTRVLDLSSLLSTKVGSDIKDFIETMSQLLDQTLRLSQGNITLDDNLKMKRVNLTVRDGISEYEIQGLPSGSPALVLFNTSTAPLDNPIAFQWKYDGRQSRVKVYLKPARPLVTVATVELIVFFK